MILCANVLGGGSIKHCENVACFLCECPGMACVICCNRPENGSTHRQLEQNGKPGVAHLPHSCFILDSFLSPMTFRKHLKHLSPPDFLLCLASNRSADMSTAF